MHIQNDIRLGSTYRDLITGFTGVATGYCAYITGEERIELCPQVGNDYVFRAPRWFDMNYLQVDVEAPALERQRHNNLSSEKD